MKNSPIVNVVEPVLREAGRTLLKFWPGKISYDNSLKVREKGDGSLVTDADEASEQVVLSALAKYFPHDMIYSEEKTAKGELVLNAGAGFTWVVDPLDGTKSFVSGCNDFSILVARVCNGEPTFGAMYFPARSLFACGEEGRGAFVNGIPIQVSNRPVITQEKRIYLRHVKLSDDSKSPDWIYPQWMDSGMAFLSVANGDFDGLIIRMIHHQEWDLAAPLRIIKEAGGRVTDGDGRDITIKCAPVDYQYLVASNGLIHDELLTLIKNFPSQSM